MTSSPRTIWLVTTLWFVLAAWQSVRGFAVCAATSTTATVFWGLQAAMLLAPLPAVWLTTRPGRAAGPRAFDVPLAFALVVYTPVTIAMRLLETCVTAQ